MLQRSVFKYSHFQHNTFKDLHGEYRMDNYSQLVERIANSSGIGSEEIERKIEAKRAKLSGLISKEGAAQIIAAELGLVLDNELLKLSQLVEGMRRVHVLGSITDISPVRSYSKQGREGKVANLSLGDETANVKVVLWDLHHIGLIENATLNVGDTIEILNGGVRNGEVHLGAFSDIKQSTQKLPGIKTKKEASLFALRDAKLGSSAKIRAVVVQIFDPKYFDDKKEPGTQRALLNLVLDDGTETIRAVVNDRVFEGFGYTKDDIFTLSKFVDVKTELLGEERVFMGNFRMNTYFNRLEFNIESVESVDPQILINELGA